MDIVGIFGASEEVSLQKFTIYLPDRVADYLATGDPDRDRVRDFDQWIELGALLLARIGGDANVGTPSLMMSAGGTENPTMKNGTILCSHIADAERFEREAWRIAQFLHTFGKRTGQGSIVIELSGFSLVEDDDGATKPGFVLNGYRIEDFKLAAEDGVTIEDLQVQLLKDLD